MNEHLGIDLDGLLPQIASLDEASGRWQAQRLGDVPPSISLGRIPGEAPRLDMCLPIDARGSGLELAVESAMDFPAEGIARLPIAYAWELLTQVQEGHRSPTWSWGQYGNSSGSITPGQALAVATRDLVATTSQRGSRTEQAAKRFRTLVVPNDLSELQQDHLLRSLRLEAGQTRLLWRPVAATLSWIQRQPPSLGEAASHHESIGGVLHLHLGAETWEAAVLEVVRYVDADGTRWLLPGRRLPEDWPLEPLRGWPSRCLEQVAAKVLQGEGAIRDARRWNLLWGTSWIHASLLDERSIARPPAVLPPWHHPQLAASARVQLARIFWNRSLGDIPEGGWPTVEKLVGRRSPAVHEQAWMTGLEETLKGHQLLGAVVTGPFAALRMPGGATLGSNLVGSITTLPSSRILVEGDQQSTRGLLACGAAEFSRRSALGQPTYLDTLPSVRMIVMVDCEPQWINLLETDAPWVMGSQTWSKEPEKTRFSIQKGGRELLVSIHRGGASTCRSVRAEFDSPTADVTPVRLHVSITPGQGAPRVEVRPSDRRVLLGKTLTFDWTTAKDTLRSDTAELKAVELVCPPHEPRIASHWKWALRDFTVVSQVRGIRELIARILHGHSTIPTIDGPAKPLLSWTRDLLKEWDRKLNLGWSTAVSSDCTLADASIADEPLLSRFVRHLDERIMSDPDEQSQALRTMAALSATGPNLILVLSHFLDGRAVADEASCWWAAGHCLRQPDHIRRMIQIACAHPSTLAFKQVARALMFRKDALATTPPNLAGKLVTLASRNAMELASQGKFQMAFQEAALLCAYLLRERIYSPDFASIGSPEFAALESTFGYAIDRMHLGARVMGGVIDKVHLVNSILEYARSRGHDRLVPYAQE